MTGYYRLSASSLDVDDLSEKQRKGLLRYLVPVALPGRLAAAESHQRKGVGSILLTDALQRVAQASRDVVVHAVTIDALSDRAAGFYQRRDFTPMPNWPLKLFLPI